jgi:tetratricopeptide (TPR) repeat protein
VVPDDPSGWNSLGYTLSYAGDYNGAMAAFREYARMRPKDANPYDSIGDLAYSFRRFKEAADNYMRAHDAQPDFEQYGDLFKAAWAKFNAGDKPGADALFSRFRAEREKLANELIPLIAADWLYRTGRRSEALDALRATVATTGSETIRANGYAQLTIWELLGHDRDRAAKDSLSIGPRLTDAPMLIARFAALPSVPAAEWESRADRLIPPSMGALRPLALAYALILDGKREAALPVWKRIVEGNAATDFFSRALYARLQGKPQGRPLVPDSAIFNPFLALL